MLRKFVLAGVAAAALSAQGAVPVQAQDQWVLLGKAQVTHASGSNKISVDLQDARGGVNAVRLTARGAPIEIDNVEVVYAGAPTHNERRLISMNPNDNTRPINPSARAAQFPDRVTISYAPRSGSSATTIEIYGRQTPALARASRPAGSGAPAQQAAAATAPAAPAASTPLPTAPTAPKKTDLASLQTTEQGDILFGTQTVGFGVDRDVIRVGNEIGKFSKIRMRVLDNDIFLRSFRVVYADGTSDELAYNADIKANSRTRWLDLKSDRFIKEIQMIYNSRPNVRGRAFVEVYGQYAPGWLGPDGEGRKYNQGWVLLGAQTAGLTIDRNDKIGVGRNEGGFRKIRVNVRNEAITLFEVRVIYGNGEVDIIPANRTRVDAGGSYGPIDLKGGQRIIQEIRPTYRTRIFQQGGVARGRALVEFWGQH